MSAWQFYKGVALYRPGSQTAYTYQTAHVEIDADGSPNAYGPHDTGLDHNANAGYPNSGWKSCLAVDPHHPGNPYVQPDGAFAGFYVSKTSLEDPTKAPTDPARYVPASEIPYVVFPGAFNSLHGTGTLGDFVIVKNLTTGQMSAGIVGDIGPSGAPLGEISIALAESLGGSNPNPRNGAGAPPGINRYVVFPGSHASPAWPLTRDEITTKANALLDAAGGWAVFDAFFQ